MEQRIPELILNKEGKVTPFVRGFLMECFNYSEASIFYTTWIYGPGHLAYDKYKPNAITWFNRVYYSPQWEEESSLELWFRYVVHEQRHRHDIHSVGSTRFYFTYLREYARLKRSGLSDHDAYMAISWEKKAYGDEDVMKLILTETNFLSKVEQFEKCIDDLLFGKEIGKQYYDKLNTLR